MNTKCAICARSEGDVELGRTEVWSGDGWRLSMSTETYTLGFAYLEPLRHIPHVEDLDGPEAATFGRTLARVSAALKQATDADRVWIYVFGGGIPHLHLHLAPHSEGDALNSAIVRGEMDDVPLPSGAHRLVSRDFRELPHHEVEQAIERTRALLAR